MVALRQGIRERATLSRRCPRSAALRRSASASSLRRFSARLAEPFVGDPTGFHRPLAFLLIEHVPPALAGERAAADGTADAALVEVEAVRAPREAGQGEEPGGEVFETLLGDAEPGQGRGQRQRERAEIAGALPERAFAGAPKLPCGPCVSANSCVSAKNVSNVTVSPVSA